MKIRVLMKTPDALEYAVTESIAYIADEEERKSLFDQLMDDLGEWFKFGESVQLEFDTEAKTAVVVKQT